MQSKVSIYLDKRHELSDHRYHIKIMFTYNVGKRQRFYFKTNVHATDKEYDLITDFKKIPRVKELEDKQTDLLKLKQKADHILKDYPFITPEEFSFKFTAEGSFRDPLGLLLVNAAQLREEGRIGNAMTFEQSHSSLKKFARGELSFAQITPKWLKKYEKHCRDAGLSITTVGIYLRPLRAVFNQERGKTIPFELYPFRERMSQKDKYKIPTSKGRKLALNEQQKNLILTFKTVQESVQKGVDFWVFSYFCNGMNFSDIARLKNKQIEANSIVYERKKTEETDRDKELIEIPIRDEVRKIMHKHGNNSLDPDAYVFPVLSKGLTEKQIKDRIHDFIANTNEALKTACEALKIPTITTYAARHTFATIAYKNGASIGFIRKALGHGDERTTKAYLDSFFDFEVKKAVSDKL
jgi:integrase/recombinase XerD